VLPDFCSRADVAALLAAAEKFDDGGLAELVIRLLYELALRVSEVSALEWSWIDRSAGVVRIIGKGSKVRLVPMTAGIRTSLDRYQQANHAYPERATSLLVLCGSKGRKLTRQALWLLVKRVVRAAALDAHISPHTLRHSLATHGVRQGWDIRQIQQLLGHEHISTTEHYLHVDKRQARTVYTKAHPRSE
jgi:site-specific recombinase XerD